MQKPKSVRAEGEETKSHQNPFNSFENIHGYFLERITREYILRYYPSIRSSRLNKATKTSIRSAGSRSWFKSSYLRNTSQKRYQGAITCDHLGTCNSKSPYQISDVHPAINFRKHSGGFLRSGDEVHQQERVACELPSGTERCQQLTSLTILGQTTNGTVHNEILCTKSVTFPEESHYNM
jgi:hypothetical protein